MCLIQLAFHDDTKSYTVIANRDEFTNRPAIAAHYWENGLFAGQDAQAGGAWLAVTKDRRFAAVTNVRHPQSRILGDRSRGELVTKFLTSDVSARDFIDVLKEERELYGGFNILLFDGDEFYHYNNIFNDMTKLATGYYTLCNNTLGTPWPKVVRVREQFIPLYESGAEPEAFIRLMQQPERAPIDQLPATGVPLEMEEKLSSIFIAFEGYGTRCTTYIRSDEQQFTFIEQTYDNGQPTTYVEEKTLFATCPL